MWTNGGRLLLDYNICGGLQRNVSIYALANMVQSELELTDSMSLRLDHCQVILACILYSLKEFEKVEQD